MELSSTKMYAKSMYKQSDGLPVEQRDNSRIALAITFSRYIKTILQNNTPWG